MSNYVPKIGDQVYHRNLKYYGVVTGVYPMYVDTPDETIVEFNSYDVLRVSTYWLDFVK